MVASMVVAVGSWVAMASLMSPPLDVSPRQPIDQMTITTKIGVVLKCL